MVYFDYDRDKVEDDYLKLVSLYEVSDGRSKYEIYGELKKYLSYVQNKKIMIPEPNGYKDYIEELKKEQINYLKEYNDLTRVLIQCWYSNIINTISGHNYSYQTNYLSPEEFQRKVLSFFDTYFKDDVDIVKEGFNNNKILLKKRIIGTKNDSRVMYFNYLNDYYIRLISGYKLNEKMLFDIIHEFGHVINYKSISKRNDNNLLDELLSTLYELKYLELLSKNNNDNINMEISHYIKVVGQIPILYAYTINDNSNNYLNPKFFDLVQKLCAHIIYLTLCNRGKEEYMKAIKLLKENANLEPIQQLYNIGIKENDLIMTASNARKILMK